MAETSISRLIAAAQSARPDYLVTRRLVEGLLDTNALPERSETAAFEFFSRLHVLAGSGMPVVRVSLGRLSPSLETDPRPYGVRRFAGIDFLNEAKLSKAERRDAWLGVWPIGLKTLNQARREALPVLGSVRGYVSSDTARIVTDGVIDEASGRYWIETRKLKRSEREKLFPAGSHGALITVPRGAIAALETL